ncbi:MAG TPA: type II secretion system major pseudopilin GspG, partial [Verrucomicrobiae bacterium]|nr:type II secretion system major pseudopilin GspG [Verrucomicrobiae bacterium]
MKIQPKLLENKSPRAYGPSPIIETGNAGPSTVTRKSKIVNRRGFTLVEMMLVVAIIGILAALVIPRIAGKSEEARVTAAQADIKGGIKSALDQFEVDNGHYPSSLQDLLQQPRNASNWHGPYLDQLPIDPWGDPYLYAFPGKH